VLVGIALAPVGAAWIAVMSSLNSGLQLALPNWVRARGLAYYLAGSKEPRPWVRWSGVSLRTARR
jgi:hypothetical protein